MAVYTNLNNNDFIGILKNFDIGEYLNHQEISDGVSNSNYFLQTSTDKYIFTVLEERTDTSNLDFYDNLLTTLGQNDFNAPLYIKNNQDCFYSTLSCGKIFTISSFLEGKSKLINDINGNDCFNAGRNLALMHVACENINIKKQNTMNSKQWFKSNETIGDKVNEILPELYLFIKNEINEFENKLNNNIPKGIIHGDYFPDNVFYNDNDVSGTIDFYYSCYEFLIYDVAIAVNAFCNNGYQSINIENAKQFIDGYQTIRKITKQEKDLFNTFLRGASIRYLTSRCYDFFHIGGDIAKKYNPIEYYNILCYHIENDITKLVFNE